MIRKFTAFLMFVIAMANALNFLGASERAAACEISDAGTVLSRSAVGAGDVTQTAFAAEHHSEDGSDCQHQDGDCRQCHLGHCQCLISSVATSIVRPDGLLRREFTSYFWFSIQLPSPDKPPRA